MKHHCIRGVRECINGSLRSDEEEQLQELIHDLAIQHNKCSCRREITRTKPGNMSELPQTLSDLDKLTDDGVATLPWVLLLGGWELEGTRVVLCSSYRGRTICIDL